MSYNLPLPDSPATAGLDFTDKPYYTPRIDLVARFHEDVAQVRRWVENNLSNFSHLNETIVLQLGSDTLPYQVLTIDATTVPPALSNNVPLTAHKSITVLPEYVLDSIEGRMHCQLAFGKLATPRTIGAIPACFTPTGLPGPCEAPSDVETLPKPTEDVARLKRDLKKWGYAICANALNAEQVRIIRTALEEQAEAERLIGVAYLDSEHKKPGDEPNQRVWNLPNKGDEFLDLLNHPIIDAVMPSMLGRAFSLFSMTANIVRPGASGLYMHHDQMAMTPDTTDVSYVINAIWYLTDVTEDKGATRVYPGSHVLNVQPADMRHVGTSIPAAAPAGSCLLLDSRTWHSMGVNTTNEPRPVILQGNNVKAKLSDRQRALLCLPSSKPGGKGQGFADFAFPGTYAGRMRVSVGKK
ncbi:phytanoyl-CoA dioxygenase [Colletotrichum zoysiae]|uniref:Phytanoyl-CoA dioxygenase n=1 Tax=Colletotrichum zoysiae TaxID=1216348 RepID=A0AAD9H915_9PEZI|nr:phytanoyl-CoA dioxygenase [Colletotrichum zoysiae]